MQLRDLLDNAGGDVKAFCKFFKVASIADLPAAKYATAVKMIETKAARR